MGLWEEHCVKYMRQWDLSLVGFVIDGHTGNMREEGWHAYARFSPDGAIFQHMESAPGVYKGMPYLETSGDLPRKEASKAAAKLHGFFREDVPNFISVRSIVMPPSWYVEIEKEIDRLGRGDAMLVDMRTLLMLVSHYHHHDLQIEATEESRV